MFRYFFDICLQLVRGSASDLVFDRFLAPFWDHFPIKNDAKRGLKTKPQKDPKRCKKKCFSMGTGSAMSGRACANQRKRIEKKKKKHENFKTWWCAQTRRTPKPSKIDVKTLLFQKVRCSRFPIKNK